MGDLSQHCQRLPELRRPGLAQMRGPSRLNLGDPTHAGLHCCGAARGDANQARTTIPRPPSPGSMLVDLIRARGNMHQLNTLVSRRRRSARQNS
jgi:hypothetical protein